MLDHLCFLSLLHFISIITAARKPRGVMWWKKDPLLGDNPAEERSRLLIRFKQAKQHPTLSSIPLLNVTFHVILPSTTCNHKTNKKLQCLCVKQLCSRLSFDISKVSHQQASSRWWWHQCVMCVLQHCCVLITLRWITVHVLYSMVKLPSLSCLGIKAGRKTSVTGPVYGNQAPQISTQAWILQPHGPLIQHWIVITDRWHWSAHADGATSELWGQVAKKQNMVQGLIFKLTALLCLTLILQGQFFFRMSIQY